MPDGTLGALAAWNRAVKSVQLPVLSDSARQAMTQSVAASAASYDLISKHVPEVAAQIDDAAVRC